ncbi:MAG TPA: hypothetical protein VLI90_13430 [Tepidisphaeraceae bacterium]|nr:hypothetical protein [Tepidisphaeraceae bacterium]
MDELIILIIKALAKAFGGDQPRRSGKGPPLPPMRGIIPPTPEQIRQQQILRATGGRRRKQAGVRAVPARVAAASAPDVLEVVEVLPDAPPTSARAAQRAAPSNCAVTAHTGGSSVSAVALRKWLTPAVLQKQFILTEILQPPLALREEK